MDSSVANQKTQNQVLTVQEVNRLLEVGSLLYSVLTADEIKELQAEFAKCYASNEIGNTGDA